MNNGRLSDEFFCVAGNLLATNLASTMRTSYSFEVIVRILPKRAMLGANDLNLRFGIDIFSFGIVIIIAVYFLGFFDKGLCGVLFVL